MSRKTNLTASRLARYAFEGQKQVTQKGFHGGKKAIDPEGKLDKDGKPVRYVTYKVVPEKMIPELVELSEFA